MLSILFTFRTTPIGVASLIACVIATKKNISEEFKLLGNYILTVMVGQFILMLVIAPLAYFILRRANPFKFIMSLFSPIMVVIATAST